MTRPLDGETRKGAYAGGRFLGGFCRQFTEEETAVCGWICQGPGVGDKKSGGKGESAWSTGTERVAGRRCVAAAVDPANERRL